MSKPSLCIAVGCAVAVLGAFAASATAAPITVNSLGDVTPANDGSCTLREAVIAANGDMASGLMPGECAAGSGADSISVPAGTVDLAIGGTGEGAAATGDLDVTTPITITGAGASMTTIDANSLDRVIDLTSTLSLNDLTITGGGVVSDGAGVQLTGASADLTATRTRFTTNVGSNGGGGGGAIYVQNNTSADVVDSTFTSNFARNCSGAICVSPGGTLMVTGSTFSSNGIHPSIGNTYSDYGGAIYTGGTTTVTNSTFSGNKASGSGGAIAVFGGTTTIGSSTIDGNTADADSSAGGDGGGIGEFSAAPVTLINTILANNGASGGPDCFGTVVANAKNLVETTTGCTGPGGTDLTGQDPVLLALADNGGPTQTRQLGSSSPAIDAGIGSPQCPAADQRGVDRPQGPACDIGAFESTPPSSTFTFPLSMQTYDAASYNAGCGGAVPDLCGTSSPNPDGAAISENAVRIRRMSDSNYWNGISMSWQSGEFWNAASGTTMWSYGFVPGLDTYTISSRATDDDNYVETPATRTFTVGLTTPPPTQIQPVQPTQPAQGTTPKRCKKGFKRKRGKCVKKKKRRPS